MAYKSKFKGKEIDDKLDLVQELSTDVTSIKEGIKDIPKKEEFKTINGESIIGEGNIEITIPESTQGEYTSVISDKTITTPM